MPNDWAASDQAELEAATGQTLFELISHKDEWVAALWDGEAVIVRTEDNREFSIRIEINVR